MKAKLEFDLTDSDQVTAFRRAVKAGDAFCALWDIGQEIFRPARKHGYDDRRLLDWDKMNPVELVSILEARFYEILAERDIDLSRDWE